MEGFIKVIKKNSLPEIKRYFFYLTYNNRADIITQNENKNSINNEFIPDTSIGITNPIQTYWDYRNSIEKEWKKSRIKNIEVILSYSTEFNYIMSNIIGEDKWEKIFQNIIKNLFLKHIKTKHKLFYFHKQDKEGYRYHCHSIIYPYETKQDVSQIYTHIPNDVLAEMKKDFHEYFLVVRDKYKKDIIEFVKKEGKKKDLKIQDNNIKEYFKNNNPKLSDNLGLF